MTRERYFRKKGLFTNNSRNQDTIREKIDDLRVVTCFCPLFLRDGSTSKITPLILVVYSLFKVSFIKIYIM